MDTFGLLTAGVGFVLTLVTHNRPSRAWFAFSTFTLGVGVGALIASFILAIQIGLLEM